MLIIIALLAGLVTFYIINAYVAGRRYSRPARMRISFADPAERGLEYEDVTLRSGDGMTLAGWYIPSKNRAAVILLHGYGGNRLGVMYHAELLGNAGFGVLLFDLRGHGDSGGGGTFARGESMIADAQAAVNFLRSRPEIDPQRIGVLGVSVGGTMALHAAVRIRQIAAVVADGAGVAAAGDLEPPTTWQGRLFLPLNRFFFRVAERQVNVAPLPPTKEVISKIAPRPVLLIATRGPETTLNERFYEAAREPKELWAIPDAGHAGGWHKHPEEYGRRVVGFFTRYLVGE